MIKGLSQRKENCRYPIQKKKKHNAKNRHSILSKTLREFVVRTMLHKKQQKIRIKNLLHFLKNNDFSLKKIGIFYFLSYFHVQVFK